MINIWICCDRSGQLFLLSSSCLSALTSLHPVAMAAATPEPTEPDFRSFQIIFIRRLTSELVNRRRLPWLRIKTGILNGSLCQSYTNEQ